MARERTRLAVAEIVCPGERFLVSRVKRAEEMPKRRRKRAAIRKGKSRKRISPASHPIWKKAKRSTAKARPLGEGHVLVEGTVVGTGFVQEPDPRDDNFPLGAVVGAVDDPRSKEKVWQLPAHLLNQGSTNSCVGYSCAHFIMAAPIMSNSLVTIELWHGDQGLDEFRGIEET